MTVKIEKLLRMAEQISANMSYTDDKEIVAAKIAEHLGRFWDPRMLKEIKAYRADHPDDMSPELSAAIASLA